MRPDYVRRKEILIGVDCKYLYIRVSRKRRKIQPPRRRTALAKQAATTPPPILRENAYRRDSDIRVRSQYLNPFGQLGTYLTIKLQACRGFVVLRVVNSKFRLRLQNKSRWPRSLAFLSLLQQSLHINLCDQPCSGVSR
jgi:hypothetical protein